MPDITFTFTAVDSGLGGAINNAKSQFSQLTGSTNQVSESINQVGDAARGAGINFQSMIERMAVRLAVMYAIREVLKLIADTIKEATAAETDFIHVQNTTGESTARTEERFEALKQIAHDTGQDLEKTVVPAFMKLRETGILPDDALAQTRVINEYLVQTGINLTDVAAKAAAGTAGFADLAKAAAAMGDVGAGQWALQWERAQAAEKSYNTELEHHNRLVKEAQEDTDRLTSAQMGFASASGLVKAAVAGTFGQFQGTPAQLAAAQHAELQRLAAGPAGSALGRQFGAGMQQIAKEEGISTADVESMLRLKMISGEELIQAAKRREEERRIGQERAQQEGQYQRQAQFETARLNANKLITQEMHDQEKAMQNMDHIMDSWAGKMLRVSSSWRESQMSMGDVARGMLSLTTGKPPETPGEAQARRTAAGFGAELLLQGTPVAPIADPIVNAIRSLMVMLQGH